MNDIKKKFEEWLKGYSPTCTEANPVNYENIVVRDLFRGFKAGAESMQPEIDELTEQLSMAEDIIKSYQDVICVRGEEIDKLRKILENNIKAMKAYEKNGLLCGNLIIARQEAEQTLKEN